jgi:ribosomal RNA assembly protein
MRIKGRIIGRDGRSRELIEEHTETFVSVYGKTVSIIGTTESVSTARRAIEMLIKGSPHSTVYRWLEKMRKELRRREYEEKFDDYLKKDDEEK